MNETVAPLVSVVIPTYNHASYLGRALQSVIDQTYTNWEAIVIDNHSTDNTDEVMASFADLRITYKKIHNNGVIAASRNVGIRVAKGEWIAFLDSDDWWHLEKLQKCLGYFINDPSIDIIYHDCFICRVDLPDKKLKCGNAKYPIFRSLLDQKFGIANSGALVKKQKLSEVGGVSEDRYLIAVEDFDLWLRLAKITNKFKYVDEFLGYHSSYPFSISNLDETQIVNVQKVYEKHVKSYSDNVREQSKIMGFCYFQKAFRYHNIGQLSKARKLYFKSLLAGWRTWKVVAGLLLSLLGIDLKFLNN
jgi:glycosyltransferase involved in cell wall biosynthesis